jgi:hypothetical protein
LRATRDIHQIVDQTYHVLELSLDHGARAGASARIFCSRYGLDSRPGHIHTVAEAMLKRLQVDSIDLLYRTLAQVRRLRRPQALSCTSSLLSFRPAVNR